MHIELDNWTKILSSIQKGNKMVGQELYTLMSCLTQFTEDSGLFLFFIYFLTICQ